MTATSIQRNTQETQQLCPLLTSSSQEGAQTFHRQYTTGCAKSFATHEKNCFISTMDEDLRQK